MKIIVAGFSKTGTKSLAIALIRLGYKVYDMLEHFGYHGEEWEKILVTGGSVEDFRKMYKDVDAVLDVPAFCFWEQIHEAFPDAKIILTMRDEDDWYRSWHKQTSSVNIDSFFKLMKIISPSGRRLFQHMKAFCPPAYGFELRSAWRHTPINEMVLKMKYRQHYEYVLKHAPEDKLLAYSIRDGWAPLCQFLGRPIPDSPFPHENVGGEVIKLFIQNNPIMQRIVKETFVSLGVILLLILFAVYCYICV
ncbi:unnamed protein product [Clavelina lepadiformis]|uniref:Sulfotransferase family protein n=1 Tax=Clavelina lepadiformis TaxID=159417 RepID=A0ABP0GBM6_CLALP